MNAPSDRQFRFFGQTLINNILDLSKIESGEVTVSQEKLNLRLLFTNIAKINKNIALQEGVIFTFNFDPRLPDVILSDRNKLNKILINLVTNAIKFTPAGKTVEFNATFESGYVAFSIKDEGIGIPKDSWGDIFGAFKQLTSTVHDDAFGTGLGLAIVRESVELLKGTIEVESEEEKGSLFTVKFPLIKTLKTETSFEEAIDETKYTYAGKRVLVVENDSFSRQAMLRLLQKMGIETTVAKNWKEGINKCREIKPDLILMDLPIKNMDGMDTIKGTLGMKDFEKIPLIVVSANAFLCQQKEAIETGFSDYLTKPVDYGKLLHLLEKHIGD